MLTPAGPDHAQIAAVQGVLDYFDDVYEHHFDVAAPPTERRVALNRMFREHENTLLARLLDFLRSRDDVQIIGPDTLKNRAPTVSIIPQHKDIDAVYESLTKHKLMLGKGDFYAVRPLTGMGIPRPPGVLRISFCITRV
ncbi:hypothetical protein [Maribacter halichondriae]|uniref:hypothetical protein n=1 Tax=Maribacter halichondriae TaxID=2980554 RepID=UPI002358C5AB|nr:hypothetical protein [Maribacter sp. Hal144]